mgnify:CR=1 FL=1
MASILDIMGWRNISTSVQKVEPGIPDPLPPEFSNLTENVLGDRTTYITFRGERRTARRTEYGAPSRARNQKPIGEQSVALVHFSEHIKIGQELLLRLRQANDLLAQQKAQELIARAGADFKQLFVNTRIAMRNSMVANAKIWFDSGGRVLPTSSGADSGKTIDYGVGANNLNQLNGLIDVAWSDAAAPIQQHVENVRIKMKQNTGRDLGVICYGQNIPGYIFKNTTVKNYWQFNPQLYNQFQSNSGVIPDGTFGVKKWVRMGDCFLPTLDSDENETGQTSVFPVDQVTFLPTLDRNAYTMYEGSMVVPSRYGVNPDIVAAADCLEVVYGMAGYGLPELEPPGAKAVYFDTVLPHWKNPLDMFLADVTF